MNMNNLLKVITSYLDNHDSSPGAWCLVKSVHDNTDACSDADAEMAYNRSESENDSERDIMLMKLNPLQLAELAAVIIEIADELIANS
jgi:hypothetical protein